jgi:hypothetical protein
MILALLLSGCGQQNAAMTKTIRAQPMPFTIVSTKDTITDVSSAATFTWARGMREIHSDPHQDKAPDKEALENAIINTLRQKGYEYTWRASLGDLHVGYTVVMNDALSDQEINDRYGIQPSLSLPAPDAARYEKGTLVIDIIDAKTGRTAWRSALQGYADLKMSREERQDRLNDMVMFMLARFPARGGVSN